MRVSVCLLAGFMLLAPAAAEATPAGLDALAGQGSSAVIEIAVKCGPHAHYIRGHRDRHGHYIKGRCVKDRRR